MTQMHTSAGVDGATMGAAERRGGESESEVQRGLQPMNGMGMQEKI